jgi:hypothetical protein
MSDRPGKSRPMPAAPYDDPSIPVLTERLTLPDLDLDITLPAFAETQPVPSQPAPTLPPTAETATPEPGLEPASPAMHAGSFETDTWLVEATPVAKAPLDGLNLDLPAFDLPPLPPVSKAPEPLPPGDGLAALLPADTPHQAPGAATIAAAAGEPDFSSGNVAIPASLMRPAAPAPVHAAGLPTASAEPAPGFEPLPAAAAGEPLPALDTAASAAGPFAVAAASPQPDEAQLRESILKAVLQRLPHEVEAIVRRQLTPAIDAAIDAAAAQLAVEIRRAAAHSLRQLIDDAVKAELAKLSGSR